MCAGTLHPRIDGKGAGGGACQARGPTQLTDYFMPNCLPNVLPNVLPNFLPISLPNFLPNFLPNLT